MKQGVSIREMARRCSLSAFTLRYYERAGLIRAVQRSGSGHRRYSAADQEWVEFLNRLRETGMSIQQMAAFARLRAEGDRTIGARRKLLQEHVEAVQARIEALNRSRRALQAKIKHYRALETSLAPSAARQSQQERTHERRTHERSIRARAEETGGGRRRSR